MCFLITLKNETMTKLQILYPILAVTLLLASCTADDHTTFVPNEAQRLSVTVTDGDYTSATTDDTSATSATKAMPAASSWCAADR